MLPHVTTRLCKHRKGGVEGLAATWKGDWDQGWLKEAEEGRRENG